MNGPSAVLHPAAAGRMPTWSHDEGLETLTIEFDPRLAQPLHGFARRLDRSLAVERRQHRRRRAPAGPALLARECRRSGAGPGDGAIPRTPRTGAEQRPAPPWLGARAALALGAQASTRDLAALRWISTPTYVARAYRAAVGKGIARQRRGGGGSSGVRNPASAGPDCRWPTIATAARLLRPRAT